MMNIDVNEVAFHRNGICGEGFHAIRFTYAPDGKPEHFLAIVFDTTGQCAVIGIDRLSEMGVRFAEGNSWRGDYFEHELREAIKKAQTGRVGPFCITQAVIDNATKP